MSKILSNPKQLEEWVDTALWIQERYGIEKALAYLIGGKVYTLVDTLYVTRKIIRLIEEERKKPDHNPVGEITLKRQRYIKNLDQFDEKEKQIILEAEGLLVKLAFLINQAFEAHEIRKYFASHPRLGFYSHVSTEEQYSFMVMHGAIEHSIEIEVQDALILGDMMKYFGINV